MISQKGVLKTEVSLRAARPGPIFTRSIFNGSYQRNIFADLFYEKFIINVFFSISITLRFRNQLLELKFFQLDPIHKMKLENWSLELSYRHQFWEYLWNFFHSNFFETVQWQIWSALPFSKVGLRRFETKSDQEIN